MTPDSSIAGTMTASGPDTAAASFNAKPLMVSFGLQNLNAD